MVEINLPKMVTVDSQYFGRMQNDGLVTQAAVFIWTLLGAHPQFRETMVEAGRVGYKWTCDATERFVSWVPAFGHPVTDRGSIAHQNFMRSPRTYVVARLIECVADGLTAPVTVEATARSVKISSSLLGMIEASR